MRDLRHFLKIDSVTLLPVLLTGWLLSRGGLRAELRPVTVPTPSEPAVRETVILPKPVTEPSTAAETAAATETEEPLRDERFLLPVLQDGETAELTLSDYVFGALAAEMPAVFHTEALKAQAVAIRTDVLYRLREQYPHPDGASCTDAACCNAFFTEAELRERWGEDYEGYAAKLRKAVSDTDGEILEYEGEAIFAAFHACSAGATEDCASVWVMPLPYLRSVSSPETEALVPNYESTVEFSAAELRRIAADRLPGAVLDGDCRSWLSDPRYTDSGRLGSVCFGGVTLSGNRLRALLGLRSTAVTWSCGEDGIRFTCRGSGHGVGLSQYGAEAMAQAGADYLEILLHYYSGVSEGYID